jgi:hypothetical protein
VSIDEIPDYAGLIYINDDNSFEIIKKQSYYTKPRQMDAFIREGRTYNLTCKLSFFNKIIYVIHQKIIYRKWRTY